MVVGRRAAALTAALAGTVAVGLSGAAPANAAVIERDRYTDTFTSTFAACDTQVQVSRSLTGKFALRLHGAFPTPFVHDRVTITETITDLATQHSFTRVLKLNHVDVRIRLVEGTVYEFTWQDSGTIVVYDSNGDVGYRDAGLIRSVAQVDTQGDQNIENDKIVGALVTEVRGHLPDRSFCADLEAYAIA